MRQVEDNQKARSLGRFAQQVVIPCGQTKMKLLISRTSQIDSSLQLEIKRRPHRTSGLNAQINTIPVQISPRSCIASAGRNRKDIGHGEAFFLIVCTQQRVGHSPGFIARPSCARCEREFTRYETSQQRIKCDAIRPQSGQTTIRASFQPQASGVSYSGNPTPPVSLGEWNHANRGQNGASMKPHPYPLARGHSLPQGTSGRPRERRTSLMVSTPRSSSCDSREARAFSSSAKASMAERSNSISRSG